MPLTLTQIGAIKQENPKLASALSQIVDAINNGHNQAGVDGTGQIPTPQPIAGISVTAANGMFEIQLTDNSLLGQQTPQAVNYTVEYDISSAFTNPRTIGPSPQRNFQAFLGNQTLYFRAFKQSAAGSQPSAPIVFGGSTPTAVTGGTVPSGGSVTPPTKQAYQGSGNSSQSGAGYGTFTGSS